MSILNILGGQYPDPTMVGWIRRGSTCTHRVFDVRRSNLLIFSEESCNSGRRTISRIYFILRVSMRA